MPETDPCTKVHHIDIEPKINLIMQTRHLISIFSAENLSESADCIHPPPHQLSSKSASLAAKKCVASTQSQQSINYAN